jgi:O-antigen/teichoic acid export membrane protein
MTDPSGDTGRDSAAVLASSTRPRPEPSLRAGVSWLILGRISIFLVSFALPLVLVRRLDQSQFGLYRQLFLVMGTMLAVLPIGFGMSAYYFLPRARYARGAIVLNVLLFHGAIGGAAFLALTLFPDLLGTLLNDASTTRYAPLVGAIVCAWIVGSLLEIIPIANQEAKQATGLLVASQVVRMLAMLGAVIYFGSVRALLGAALLHAAYQVTVLLGYLRSRFRGFWRRFDPGTLWEQFRYAVPLGVAVLLGTIQVDLHNYFVAYRLGVSAFAVYAIGAFELPIVGIVGDSVASVLLPRVNLLHEQGSNRDIVALTAEAIRKLALAYFPIYVLLLVVARDLIILLFTARYAGSWNIFVVNLTLLPLSVLIIDPVVRAYAEGRRLLLPLRLVSLPVSVLALWLAVGRFGMVGAIIVTVAMNVAERVILTVRLAQVLGVNRDDSRLLRDPLIIAVVAAFSGALTALLRASLGSESALVVLIVCGLGFFLVYGTTLALSGVVRDGEWRALRELASQAWRAVRWPALR